MANEVSGFLTSHTWWYINRIEPIDFLDYLNEKEKLIMSWFVPYETSPSASLLEMKMDIFEKNAHPLNLYADTFILFNPADKEFELFVAAKRLEEIVEIEKRLSIRLMNNIIKKKWWEVSALIWIS